MKLMTQTEFAKRLNITQQRVSMYIKHGKISPDCLQGKKIIYEKAIKAVSRNLDQTKSIKAKIKKNKKVSPAEMATLTTKAGTNELSMADAQIWQARYKAALLQLEFEEKKGILVKAEDVKKSAFNWGRQIRDALLNIPERISAQLAAENDSMKCREMLSTEISNVLSELSE